MTFKLDRKQRVREILKCGKDPSYFLKTYARISHPLHGLVPFNTYPFQDDLLKDFTPPPYMKKIVGALWG